jgi:hypothetical protein
LIREFLKRSGFNKTYDSFIEEDTRDKVKMTKNQLTGLLGIDMLMKRNAQDKVFTTMLDILCDFLIISKDINNGVNYPDAKTKSTPKKDSMKSALPPSANSRPKTSGGPGLGNRPILPSKPMPMKNAFCAGSNADISEANIDMSTGMLNKQSSKQNLQTKKMGFMNE